VGVQEEKHRGAGRRSLECYAVTSPVVG